MTTYICIILMFIAALIMVLIGNTAIEEGRKNNPAFRKDIDVMRKLYDDTTHYCLMYLAQYHPHKSPEVTIPLPYDLRNRITMLTDKEEKEYTQLLEHFFTSWGFYKMEFSNKKYPKGPFTQIIAYNVE